MAHCYRMSRGKRVRYTRQQAALIVIVQEPWSLGRCLLIEHYSYWLPSSYSSSFSHPASLFSSWILFTVKIWNVFKPQIAHVFSWLFISILYFVDSAFQLNSTFETMSFREVMKGKLEISADIERHFHFAFSFSLWMKVKKKDLVSKNKKEGWWYRPVWRVLALHSWVLGAG